MPTQPDGAEPGKKQQITEFEKNCRFSETIYN